MNTKWNVCSVPMIKRTNQNTFRAFFFSLASDIFLWLYFQKRWLLATKLPARCVYRYLFLLWHWNVSKMYTVRIDTSTTPNLIFILNIYVLIVRTFDAFFESFFCCHIEFIDGFKNNFFFFFFLVNEFEMETHINLLLLDYERQWKAFMKENLEREKRGLD